VPAVALSIPGCARSRASLPHLFSTLSEVCSDHDGRRLLWFQRLFDTEQFGRTPVALAVHVQEGAGEWSVYTLTAYAVTSHGLRLDVCVRRDAPYWRVPIIFRDGRDTLALFETLDAGSASYHQYALLVLDETAAREIPIDGPTVTLADQIADGQYSEAGRTRIGFLPEYGPGPAFEFSIWTRGESNNFPSGGTVHGRMEVRRNAAGRAERLVVGEWQKTPPP
jgi:hypothetical protein